jgi:hypothetical protein
MTFRVKPAQAKPEGPFWERHKLPEPIAIAVILYPGLLSERIAALFADSPALDGTQLIASALAVTLVNLALALLLGRLFANRNPLFQWKGASVSTLLIQPVFIVAITGISIGTGLLWAVVDSKDLLYKVGLTDMRSRADLFSSAAGKALEDHDWARVTTSGGAIYHGLLFRHDSHENGGLYLLGPKLELEGARKESRLAPLLAACHASSACRIPVPCVDVGTSGVGAVFIPRSQIVTVEYRPPETHAGRKIYSCDLISTGP